MTNIIPFATSSGFPARFIEWDAVAEFRNILLSSPSCENIGVSIKPGDTVLFSCGGASFNDFKNYEERGNFFKSVVLNIKEKND